VVGKEGGGGIELAKRINEPIKLKKKKIKKKLNQCWVNVSC